MLNTIREWIHIIYDVPTLIAYGGMFILIAIVFAETGLMVGFFLPGDSLLVTAGLFAAKGDLSIFWLIVLLSIAAILGDSTGYWIGKKAGPAIYKREDSGFFKKSHLKKAEQFYIRHGGKTIILARFVPIIRTFAPVVAGAAGMEYKRFVSFNIFGGIFWVASMSLVGYYLGKVIPNIDKNIDIVVIIVIFLSFLPIIFEWWRNSGKASKEIEEKIAAQSENPDEVRGYSEYNDPNDDISNEVKEYNDPNNEINNKGKEDSGSDDELHEAGYDDPDNERNEYQPKQDKEIDNRLSNLDRNDEPTFFQNLNKTERSDSKPPKRV